MDVYLRRSRSLFWILAQTAQVNGSIGDQAVLIHIAPDFGREAQEGEHGEKIRLSFVLFLPLTA